MKIKNKIMKIKKSETEENKNEQHKLNVFG